MTTRCSSQTCRARSTRPKGRSADVGRLQAAVVLLLAWWTHRGGGDEDNESLPVVAVVGVGADEGDEPRDVQVEDLQTLVPSASSHLVAGGPCRRAPSTPNCWCTKTLPRKLNLLIREENDIVANGIESPT